MWICIIGCIASLMGTPIPLQTPKLSPPKHRRVSLSKKDHKRPVLRAILKQPQTKQRLQVLAFALAHNPDLQAAKAQLQRAFAAHRGSLPFPSNPTFSAGGGVQLPVSGTSNSSGSSILPRVQVDLSLRVPVGGRWGRMQKLAWITLQWWKLRTQWQRLQLQLQTHQAMNRVAVAWHVWQKQREIDQFMGRLEQLTQRRIQHGAAIQLDLQLAQTARLQAQQSTLAAELQYQTQRQQLATLLGWELSQKPMPWPLHGVPTLPKVAVAPKSNDHLRIQLARAVVSRANANLALARAQAVPDLGLAVGYSLEDNNHIIRGSLSIDLPVFWRNQSGVGQGHAQLRYARLLLVREQFALRQRLRLARTQYQMRRRMVTLLQRRLRTAQARSQLIERGLQQGNFSLFQVLTTQRSILRNQLLFLRSIGEAHDAYIQLCLAMGKMPVYSDVLKLSLLASKGAHHP